jgi:hypothetical protein
MMIDRNVVSAGFGLLVAGPRIGNARSEAGMWPAPVIMRDPLFEKTPQVPLVERDQEVQAFAANCTDHSLTKSVGMSIQLRRMAMLRFDVSE